VLRRRRQAAPESARDVLGYFLRHPEAADTLEGVARWRLMQERIQQSVEEVAQALEWLVVEGLLLVESAQGADPVFRLSREKASEAEKFVTDTTTLKGRRKLNTGKRTGTK
jgi:hypothetical protein